jgi:hypothetical protein
MVKEGLKKSYTRTALLALLDGEISYFTKPNEHSMTLRITKKDWLRVMECVSRVKKPKEVKDDGDKS